MIEQFHFLRPLWLLALIPLIAVVWHSLKHRVNSRSWQNVVDAALLPHLLSGKGQGRRSYLWLLLSIAALLAIAALAGPVWEKLPQPVFRQQAALVIALDLSRSMDTSDIKPSRLARARHKIADILNQRKQGQTALVNYAADAFVVTPLTEDSATINALLPSLSTDMMPSQGSHADKAIEQSIALFDNAGLSQGDILLVTDGFTANEANRVQSLLDDKPQYRLSVLAVGTTEGGPIPLPAGGFLKDAQGAIVITKTNEASLRQTVSAGSGAYQLIRNDGSDINRLLQAIQRNQAFENDAVEVDLKADVWRELGPWLVLLLLPMVALVFRRGVMLVLPLLLLPLSYDAEAQSWDEIWKNSNQRGSEAFEQGEHQSAAELFDDQEWQASANYRAGDYEAALEGWAGIDSEQAHYNRGNALSRLGRLEESVAAYDQALELNANHADASHNKKLVEDALRQQQKQDQPGDSDQDQDQSDDEQEKSDESSEQDQDKQDDSQSGDQQSEENAEESSEQSQDSEQTPEPQSQPEQAEAQDTEESTDLDQQMSEQAIEQWLRKIPDDPGGLLRRKFLYQYRQRDGNRHAQNPW